MLHQPPATTWHIHMNLQMVLMPAGCLKQIALVLLPLTQLPQ
jgi:hypothetical protein